MTDEQKAIFAWMKGMRELVNKLAHVAGAPELSTWYEPLTDHIIRAEMDYLTACLAKKEGIK